MATTRGSSCAVTLCRNGGAVSEHLCGAHYQAFLLSKERERETAFYQQGCELQAQRAFMDFVDRATKELRREIGDTK